MHPARQDNCLSDSDLLRVGVKVGNDKHFDVVSSQTFAKDGSPHLSFVLVSTNFLDKVAQVAVGVGVAVREVNGVKVIYKVNEMLDYVVT